MFWCDLAAYVVITTITLGHSTQGISISLIYFKSFYPPTLGNFTHYRLPEQFRKKAVLALSTGTILFLGVPSLNKDREAFLVVVVVVVVCHTNPGTFSL